MPSTGPSHGSAGAHAVGRVHRVHRVAVVGLGTAGAALACLLADRGVEVEVLEQADDPRPVGAGIWLQRLGQEVLDRLDLLGPLRAASREVARVDLRRGDGRPLATLDYAAVPGAVAALGVHRATLFALLRDAVAQRGVPVRHGTRVHGVHPSPDGVRVRTSGGDHGPYDLVVGADGARSRVREALGLAARDRPYAYGALWAVVDDPEGLAGDRLLQCVRGTREYVGVLPTGLGRASLFWSEPAATMAATQAAGLDAWRRRAAPLAAEAAPLLDRVEVLLPATYRDVVVRTPYRVGRAGGAVLVGDAAHAMSPQLGVGTSLALADAWSLAHHLGRVGPAGGGTDLAGALAAHARSRAAHVRWYQWWSRLLVPVFQSDLDLLAAPRDAVGPLVARLPGAAGQAVRTLEGDRTAPWARWTLPGRSSTGR